MKNLKSSWRDKYLHLVLVKVVFSLIFLLISSFVVLNVLGVAKDQRKEGIQTANWVSHKTPVFSFSHPPHVLINQNSGIDAMEYRGPVLENSREYKDYFLNTVSNHDVKILVDTKNGFLLREKPTYMKRAADAPESSPSTVSNRTSLVVPNIRFYQNGQWNNNGAVLFVFYNTGDSTESQKLVDDIISTIKFNNVQDDTSMFGL